MDARAAPALFKDFLGRIDDKFDKTILNTVLSGGGLKGYFVIGARTVLESQLQQRNLRVCRYAGASAGAVCTAWLPLYLHELPAVEPLADGRTYVRAQFARDPSQLLTASAVWTDGALSSTF